MTQVLNVTLAGFVNPSYLTPASLIANDAGAAALGQDLPSKGYPIQNRDAVAITFIGSPTVTVTHEQTLDPDGLVGWTAVNSIQSSAFQTQQSSSASAGITQVFPVLGKRMRHRVTALAGADLLALVDTLSSFSFPPTSSVAGALPAGTNKIGEVALQPGGAAANAVTPVATAVLAASLVAKASAGNLFGVHAKIQTGGAAAQLLVFDSATVPADGVVTPKLVLDVPAAGTLFQTFDFPQRFAAGISLALSSTGPYTKTLAVAPNLGHIAAWVL